MCNADTATHEAGHVVCALASGVQLVSAVLDPGGLSGHVDYRVDTKSASGMVANIVTIIGGPLAVARKLGVPLDYSDSRWRSDRTKILETLSQYHALCGDAMPADPFACGFYRQQVQKADQHLAENWRLVEHIAIELLTRGTVSGERLEDLCISADEPVTRPLFRVNALGLWPVLQAC